MPPKIWSRYEFSVGYEKDGTRLIGDRIPFRFRQLSDNIKHIVRSGDSLFAIANIVYSGFTDRPDGLWWIIADFQPNPVVDPTLKMEVGRTVYCPSERTIREEIFNPNRVAE